MENALQTLSNPPSDQSEHPTSPNPIHTDEQRGSDPLDFGQLIKKLQQPNLGDPPPIDKALLTLLRR